MVVHLFRTDQFGDDINYKAREGLKMRSNTKLWPNIAAKSNQLHKLALEKESPILHAKSLSLEQEILRGITF